MGAIQHWCLARPNEGLAAVASHCAVWGAKPIPDRQVERLCALRCPATIQSRVPPPKRTCLFQY